MDAIERRECKDCGSERGRKHEPDCPARGGFIIYVTREYAPADQLRGAVERAEKAEALARKLYALMGEEAERLLPGDLESSELLREGGR